MTLPDESRSRFLLVLPLPGTGAGRKTPGVGADPVLDERSFEALEAALLRRIAVHSPDWTDFNRSDPGITLLQLFAFLGETLLWIADERRRQRRRRRARRIALLVVGVASVGLAVWRAPKDSAG